MGEVVLKPVADTDLSLISGWLNKAYMLKWYHDADDWMNEIRNRHGEFRLIWQYIAFKDGKSFGFCQYYDCFEQR